MPGQIHEYFHPPLPPHADLPPQQYHRPQDVPGQGLCRRRSLPLPWCSSGLWGVDGGVGGVGGVGGGGN